MNSKVAKLVSGALRTTIHEHGPITPKWIGSAAKRVTRELESKGFLLPTDSEPEPEEPTGGE